RYRQFNQFGVELLGADSIAADAEIIDLINNCFDRLGVKNVSLEINSIGCKQCRPEYTKALVEYFEKNKEKLCPTCIERLYKNPMRILDCKSEICSSIAKNAPKNIDYLCDDCKDDFENLKDLLTVMNINFKVNPKIVRGLDYYTKTVFEFVTDQLGSQGTVCGGGRYNGLVKQLGGSDLGGIGFAIGLERLIGLMEAQNLEFKMPKKCDLYIAPIGEKALKQAVKITSKMRSEGFFAQTDLVGRSIKSQMKYADKIGAKFTVVIGDDEIEKGIVNLKNMENGETSSVNLENELMSAIYDAGIADVIGQISTDFEGLLKQD
ncbi:MAG: histidine--tRNA ligase, partial [Oscillospiraceae bacterium]